MNRSAQLTSLHALHELREQAALSDLQKFKRTVAKLETHFAEIESRVECCRKRIRSLDDARQSAQILTVANLKEEASHRATLEDDLHTEMQNLDGSLKALSDAIAVLTKKRLQWYQQHERVEALAGCLRG